MEIIASILMLQFPYRALDSWYQFHESQSQRKAYVPKKMVSSVKLSLVEIHIYGPIELNWVKSSSKGSFLWSCQPENKRLVSDHPAYLLELSI